MEEVPRPPRPGARRQHGCALARPMGSPAHVLAPGVAPPPTLSEPILVEEVLADLGVVVTREIGAVQLNVVLMAGLFASIFFD